MRAVAEPRVALQYAGIVLGIAAARCAYGVARTRSLRFLLFIAYGFIHVTLLLPARLHALATLWRTHWGTRGMHRTNAADGVPEPIRVLQAQLPVRIPRPRASVDGTTVTVADTRAARTAVETFPSTRQHVLPVLERGAFGRWRPARGRSTVVVVPRQRTGSSDEPIDWAEPRLSLAVSG
jgi:hypothetical protein